MENRSGTTGAMTTTTMKTIEFKTAAHPGVELSTPCDGPGGTAPGSMAG